MLTIALVAFPGFETRGLVMGLIIGWWPFPLLGPLIGDTVLRASIVYPTIFLLSGVTVGLCAWVMDRASLTKKAWLLLLFSIIAGAAVIYALNDYGFEDWKRSPAVSAAMNSPEVSYEPTRWDFDEVIVIPKMLAGGMWGLYVATALSFLYSIAVILLRKRQLKSQMPAAARS